MPDCLTLDLERPEAQEHLACVRQLVDRQTLLVARLQEEGRDATLAEEILCAMEGLLHSMEENANAWPLAAE